MVVYSILLIQLNHRALPETIKIRSYSLGTLVVSALFYGCFSTVYIIDQFTST
jgi:hypothetical protein